MKTNTKQNLLGLAMMAASMGAFAQSQATFLQFPFVANTVDHEFGYSTCEYNNHSFFGTEFNEATIFSKNGQFQFRAVGPQGSGFGHSLGMNSNWLVAGARTFDGSPNDGNTYSAEGAVFLSKSVNGLYQNNFNVVLTAQAPLASDNYGKSVDLDGEWMVVGANQPSPNTVNKGYIEIWKQNSTNTGWNRIQKISPSSLTSGADFGLSVAIKGNYIVVGAPGAKKIFVYKNTNSVWSQIAEYAPNLNTWAQNDGYGTYYSKYGWDVDITDNYLIVGDPSAHKAQILSLNNNTLAVAHTLTHPQSPYYGEFGYSVAIQYNRALVGAPFSFYPLATPGADIKGNIFYFTDGYQYKGRMNTSSPSGYIIRGLGRSVSIHSDNVLGGAEYTANNNVPSFRFANAYGAVFRMPFWQSIGFMRTENATFEEAQSGVLFPTIVDADETITINPELGTISKVNVSTLMGVNQSVNLVGNSVDVSGLASGRYVVTVETTSGSYVQKIVKK